MTRVTNGTDRNTGATERADDPSVLLETIAAILERDEQWNADTFQDVADQLLAAGYGYTDERGYFRADLAR